MNLKWNWGVHSWHQYSIVEFWEFHLVSNSHFTDGTLNILSDFAEDHMSNGRIVLIAIIFMFYLFWKAYVYYFFFLQNWFCNIS